MTSWGGARGRGGGGIGGSPCCFQTPEVSIYTVRPGERPSPHIPQGLTQLLGASPATLSDRRNCNPPEASTSRQTLYPSSPHKAQVSSPGAELIRKKFPEICPRIQGIRTSHPASQAPFRGPGSWDRSRDSLYTRVLLARPVPAPSPRWPRPPETKVLFSLLLSGSPHFRQTCACFPSAGAHLGRPPRAPPYPGDKPRIVSIDLINDNTPHLLPLTLLARPAPPLARPGPSEVSLVLSAALPQPKNRRLMSSGERNRLALAVPPRLRAIR